MISNADIWHHEASLYSLSYLEKLFLFVGRLGGKANMFLACSCVIFSDLLNRADVLNEMFMMSLSVSQRK